MDRRTFVALAATAAASSLLSPTAFAQTAPKARNVVLVHGLFENSRTWRRMIARLARTHTVIAPDLFGHGESDAPSDIDYSPGGHAGQLGARGGRRIGDVRAVAREMPGEPGVDRAEGELAALCARARAFHVVEDPFDLRAREIRVDHETGIFTDILRQSLAFQFLAFGSCSFVLPDNGVVHGHSCFAIPHHGGLALVGDTNGSDG